MNLAFFFKTYFVLCIVLAHIALSAKTSNQFKKTLHENSMLTLKNPTKFFRVQEMTMEEPKSIFKNSGHQQIPQHVSKIAEAPKQTCLRGSADIIILDVIYGLGTIMVTRIGLKWHVSVVLFSSHRLPSI
ncbi:hypothetical protein V8G54_012666 [Vigna mungo]|uniref:Uncharacterized protein n=1 Tax=Vigna mungo TaxID=3915 RepID=A0AAQ3NTM2_VIGMU